MKIYFKFVGCLIIVGSAAGLGDCIYSIISKSIDSIFLSVLLLITIIFCGPALGFLFISYANFLPEKQNKTNKTNKIKSFNIGDVVTLKYENISSFYSNKKIPAGTKGIIVKIDTKIQLLNLMGMEK